MEISCRASAIQDLSVTARKKKGPGEIFLGESKPRCVDGVNTFKTSKHSLDFYHTSITKKSHKAFRDLSLDRTFKGRCKNYSWPLCIFYRRQLIESKRLASFPLDRTGKVKVLDTNNWIKISQMSCLSIAKHQNPILFIRDNKYLLHTPWNHLRQPVFGGSEGHSVSIQVPNKDQSVYLLLNILG